MPQKLVVCDKQWTPLAAAILETRPHYESRIYDFSEEPETSTPAYLYVYDEKGYLTLWQTRKGTKESRVHPSK